MKIVIALPLLWAAAQAETISDAERQKVLDYLERTETKLSETVRGLSPAQWNYKSAPNRWSILECVEHLGVTEETIMKGMRKALGDAAPEKLSRDKDQLLLRAMPDRSRKATAPEEVAPQGRFTDPGQAVAYFSIMRAMTTNFVRESKDDLRGHGFKHFAFGDLDVYQWALLVAAHSERHTKQIEEVKADPGFPKN